MNRFSPTNSLSKSAVSFVQIYAPAPLVNAPAPVNVAL